MFQLQKAFQDFNRMMEERGKAITSIQINWFTGFDNRGYNCVVVITAAVSYPTHRLAYKCSFSRPSNSIQLLTWG